MRAATDPQRLERWRDAPLRAALSAPALDVRADAVAPAQCRPPQQSGQQVQGRRELRAHEARTASVGLHDVELQSGLQALRNEGTHAVVADRSQAIAGLLESKLGDLGKSIGALGERFASLDGIATLGERLSAIDKLAAANHSWPDAWDELRTHMEAVEGRVASRSTSPTASPTRFAAPGQTEAALQLLQEEAERHRNPTASARLHWRPSVRAHRRRRRRRPRSRSATSARSTRRWSLGANQQTLGDNFTAWRIETGGDITSSTTACRSWSRPRSIC
jgi:hypothetical protein